MTARDPFAGRPVPVRSGQPSGLAEVLDKGLVVAGDIQINLLDIELLTVKVRLLLASADTAQQMGIDWWQHDPFLSSQNGELAAQNAELRERIARLERAAGMELPPEEGAHAAREGAGPRPDEGERR